MSNEKVDSSQFVVGLKETLKALKADQVETLVIARDVQLHLLSDVLLLAYQNHIPIAYADHSKMLGNRFGIQVKAMVAAYLKA